MRAPLSFSEYCLINSCRLIQARTNTNRLGNWVKNDGLRTNTFVFLMLQKYDPVATKTRIVYYYSIRKMIKSYVFAGSSDNVIKYVRRLLFVCYFYIAYVTLYIQIVSITSNKTIFMNILPKIS